MHLTKRRVSLHNLGCKVNSYETDLMTQKFIQAGYEVVPFGEEADIYVINTCTVTNVADRKSRQMLRRAKKTNPQAVVVAVGCYAQIAEQEADVADLWIGNNHKSEIVDIVKEYLTKHTNVYVEDTKGWEFEESKLEMVTEHTRVSLKIQDGCNQFCSYCIIPYARGRVRSKNPQKVLAEVQDLVRKGYKEIVLTGIHLSSYGVDFTDKQPNLLGIIQMLHEINGLERIRLGSLEPGFITEETVEELVKLEKVCPHFHLSLQSGCDATLKRMNRRYTSGEYKEKCDILRKYYANPAITTDVIVGFPGETEEEFASTKRFLADIHFAQMHVFKYSMRKGTKAAAMESQVPEPEKERRSHILLELDEKLEKEYKKSFVGQTMEVLFEESMEHADKIYQVGHTKNYLKVAIPITEDLQNQTMYVKISSDCINVGRGENSEIMLAEQMDLY
ncbi:MAG: tRNA (N(6)-L-threonylcarbamoyladenosine(37)-C(2))-methylthiotransferase MtaB [Lachnospiraceae bacterium]|nr:tRNA (N(6)-L-threonylcarbamoyladenosine(37)-C(2))-methylthiotransferase MtaB [Lachnospiraceae bacterium]